MTFWLLWFLPSEMDKENSSKIIDLKCYFLMQKCEVLIVFLAPFSKIVKMIAKSKVLEHFSKIWKTCQNSRVSLLCSPAAAATAQLIPLLCLSERASLPALREFCQMSKCWKNSSKESGILHCFCRSKQIRKFLVKLKNIRQIDLI